MTFKNYRQQSRDVNWGIRSDRDGLSLEQINTGSLLRIADATEKMCLDREKLERDYKYMRDERDRYRDLYCKEYRRNAALRGVITRLKRQMTQREGEE